MVSTSPLFKQSVYVRQEADRMFRSITQDWNGPVKNEIIGGFSRKCNEAVQKAKSSSFAWYSEDFESYMHRIFSQGKYILKDIDVNKEEGEMEYPIYMLFIDFFERTEVCQPYELSSKVSWSDFKWFVKVWLTHKKV